MEKELISIHDEEKLKILFEENGIKKFRYSQLENALYKNFVTDFDEMTTLSKDLRNVLKENTYLLSLTVDTQKTSENGQTTKILFKTASWEFIETVIMRHLTGRVTLCISCQVGCPMACTFCATWKLWLRANLTYPEMAEQIFYAADLLNKEGDKLRNIVFMWMGEPMLNYDNMKKTIQFACNQKKLDLANRRITVSTCWIIPWIRRFTEDFSQSSLAISLHAPNDEIRKSIMPVEQTYPLNDLMDSLDDYVKKTNKKVFYEYIMLSGVNDSIFLADELWKLLQWRLAHVNFIPYNAWEGTGGTYKTTPRFLIEKFQKILMKYWVVSTIRMTMWDDIDAACGQLANKK